MICVIARHESLALLRSAQTWVLGAILAFLFGYLFLEQLEAFIAVQDQIALQDYPLGLSGFLSVGFLQSLTLVVSIVAPLLAMRAFSDEYRQNTYALWQSSPVSSTALTLGKFSGLIVVQLLYIGMALCMMLILRGFAPIDLPVIFSAATGLLLCSAATTACGLYFSSLTRHGLIAIVASLAFIILLWLLGSTDFGELPLQGLRALSIRTHIGGFFQGYLQSADIAYFLLLTLLFLLLTIIRLDSLRQNGY